VVKLCDFGLSRGIVFDDTPVGGIPSESLSSLFEETNPAPSAVPSNQGGVGREFTQYIDDMIRLSMSKS
jgi:hypothetical protein